MCSEGTNSYGNITDFSLFETSGTRLASKELYDSSLVLLLLSVARIVHQRESVVLILPALLYTVHVITSRGARHIVTGEHECPFFFQYHIFSERFYCTLTARLFKQDTFQSVAFTNAGVFNVRTHRRKVFFTVSIMINIS